MFVARAITNVVVQADHLKVGRHAVTAEVDPADLQVGHVGNEFEVVDWDFVELALPVAGLILYAIDASERSAPSVEFYYR